jgi:hypothetical protein
MAIIQEAIHKIEVAGGMRYLRVGLVVLAVLGVTAFYNSNCFKNMGSQEAMDSAQLARNIAQGKGYTTDFIRPFSMFLFRRHNEQNPSPQATRLSDLTSIKDRHPDISNPPAYPLVLAGLMKVLPFRCELPSGTFRRYQPDFLIGAFNQLLFFAMIVAMFFLARRLFDAPTAWLTAALLYGADIFWRFSISGQSTMLLLLIFSGISWCLVLIEEGVRNSDRGLISLLVLALFSGLLLGIGGLTRYSFAWLFIPTLVFMTVFGGSRRWWIAGIALLAFLAVMLPWVIRNYHLTGTPFGTAGYAIYDGTALFPENHMDRSLQPELTPPLGVSWLNLLTQKFILNTRQIIQNDALRLGGGFVSVFFLVGLMVVFPNPAAARLRYFVLGCLLLLIFVQALGRTHLTDDSPEINTENLLALLAPMILLFGVHFFWLLLGQIYLPLRELRYVAVGFFCLVACLPMVFNFLPPKTSPIAYPPYFPPYIQSAASYIKEDELSMCDIPWAMAWYGRVPSIWATETAEPFLEIDALQKPIKELYFTSVTLNARFLTEWMKKSDGWGYLMMPCWSIAASQGKWPREIDIKINRLNAPPAPLPLHYLQEGMPQACLVTSRESPAVQPKTEPK